MDAIATYGMSKGWQLRKYIVLVEGTSDEALFKLAGELLRPSGIELLGEEISIVAAGENERGGTFGVGRELITLRAMAPYILDQDGNPFYRTIGLIDNDYAGRRIIEDIANIDRGASEYRDIVRLRPSMPRIAGASPDRIREEIEFANAEWWGLDWEIEDFLSDRLTSRFCAEFPHTIREEVSMGGRTHLELTREGKREFHRFIHREATLNDLDGIVDVVQSLRAIVGLIESNAE